MRTLVRLLLRRELTGSATTLLLGTAAAAALAGAAAARLAALDPMGAGPRGGATIITRFDVSAAVALAVLACIRLTARPAEDHVAGWLHGYAGRGGSRAAYLAAVYVAVVLAAGAALTAAVITFGSAVLIAGAGQEVLLRAPRVWLMGMLMIGSCAAYGLAFGVLIKDAGTALAAAVLAIVLPFAVAVPYVLATDAAGLPRWARVALFTHVPPVGLDASPALLAHHGAFLAVAVLLGRWLSARIVGRWS
jgi:hypothetical protein